MRTSCLLLLLCLSPLSITGRNYGNCGSCIDAGQKFSQGECYDFDEACPPNGAACCATRECCKQRRKTCLKCTKAGHTFQWNGRFRRSRGTCYDSSSEAAVCDPGTDTTCCDGRSCCDANRSIPALDTCAECVGAGRAWQGGDCLETIDGGMCPIADLDCCTEPGCCGIKPKSEIDTCDGCMRNQQMWKTAGCTDVLMLQPGTCPGAVGSCCTPDHSLDCCLARFPRVSEPEPVDSCEACVRAGRPFQLGTCKEFIEGGYCPVADVECCTDMECCLPKPKNVISTCQECFETGFMWKQSGSEGACSDVIEQLPPGVCPGESGSCCTRESLPKCCLQFPRD